MNLAGHLQGSANVRHMNARYVQPEMVRSPSPSTCWVHQVMLGSPSQVYHRPITLGPRSLHDPFLVWVSFNSSFAPCQMYRIYNNSLSTFSWIMVPSAVSGFSNNRLSLLKLLALCKPSLLSEWCQRLFNALVTTRLTTHHYHRPISLRQDWR